MTAPASYDRVLFAVADGIAEIRLTRPGARNAIDAAMVTALETAVASCVAEPSVRAVLISADGPSFTVGGDVRHFMDHLDDLGDEFVRMIPGYHRALVQLSTLDVPVVAAVQGGVAGGGLGLVWVADIVLAADDALFATGFANLGVSGDGGSSWFLPRLVGLRRAQELLISGRVLRSEEALAWGLVTRVVPRADLHEAAATEARRLAAGATFALGQLRHLLRRSWDSTLPEQFDAELAAIVRCAANADAAEGMSAFATHRPPQFGAPAKEHV